MTSVGHSRTTSLVNDAKHSMANNGVLNLPPGQGNRNGGDPRPGGAPLPHIDDILAIPTDIDSNLSIKRLLEMAETALRQAEMAREFNRPALALKDYIRASIIAVQVISSHRDYAPSKGGRDDLARAHTALLNRISQQDTAFARVKQEIIADNKRSGVQPTAKRPGSSQGHGTNPRPQSPIKMHSAVAADVSPRTSMSYSPSKPKPMIQPKPQSLHGKALRPGPGSGSKPLNHTNQDIAARFANLRGPQPSPGQDPRIKTHTIVPPRPQGPRDMPQKPRVSVGGPVPSLPKMPDAIYSPARGSVSGDTQRPPRPGTPRGVYSRTGSSASVNGTPTAAVQTQSDYFAPRQSYSNTNIPPPTPGNPTMKIPDGDVITPEELFQAMKGKGTILIIDVRIRSDFNEGHIMSSSTICIEPSILLRDNLSADQINESLVLSPTQEQSLFDNRDKYDLVVFYDEDSLQVPKSPQHSDDLVIMSIHRALVHFNYGKELRNSPKILKGGIAAWIDLMGPASLRSTSVAKPKLPEHKRNRSVTIERRKSKYTVKPLKPDDVRAWQETLKNDDMQTGSSPNFLRTTEDFLRRFPPVATEQESMTSPVKPQPKPAYGLSHKVDLYTDLPSPPTRPAPALPRPSHTGRSQGADDNEILEHTSAALARQTSTGRVQMKPNEPPSSGEIAKYYTGLNNPGNWCYANSSLQSLLASPNFGRELADSEWMIKYKAPRKPDEKIEHPQLMARIVSNLFHWMSTGKFQVMKAQTLMDYSRHLCKQNSSVELFGGTQQQDAQEFMSFLLAHLHDETNSQRSRLGEANQPGTKYQSLLQASAQYWRDHLEFNQSIIDHYWRGIELGTVLCRECDNYTYRFTPYDVLPVPVNLVGDSMTLEQVMTQWADASELTDFACATCGRATRARQSLSFARLPSLLCVAFRRFHYIQDLQTVRKSLVPVTWDFNDLDLSDQFVERSESANGPKITDQAFIGPFRYECYAVIVHAGTRVDNGHYFAYVRDSSSHDPYAWFCCNDNTVSKVRIGCGGHDDIKNRVFKNGQQVPYLAFFRRKER